MNSITTILQYGHNKHCFLSLVDSFQRKHSSKTTVSDSRIDNEIVVYEVELRESRKAYLSLFGKPYKLVSGDRVQLNGLFADKLGLRDEDPLVLKEIKSAVPSARRLQVEPMTVDDWEILEENSGRVETVLLDQVRVVWPGQILPVWIQRSICLFMKVVSVEPMAPCVVLENSSEIVVTPKIRSHPPPSSLTLPSNQKVASLTAQWQQRQKNQEAKSKQDHSTKLSKSSQEQQNNISSPCKARSMQDFNTDNENDLSVNENTLEPRLVPRSPSRSPRTSFKKMSSLRQKSVLSSSDPMNERGEMNRPLVRRQSSLMESVMKYIFPFITERRDDSDSHSESDAGSAIDYSMRNLPSRNGVLRIQPMKLSCSLDKCFSKTELSKSLSGYRGTQVLSTHSEEGKTCVVPCEIFQPSTVYVDAECTKNERLLHPYLPHLPNNFIARIQKIPSPQEKTEMSQKEGVKGKSDGKGNVEPKIPLVDDDSSTEPKMSTEQLKGDVTGINSGSCYVRVVAIDRKAGLTEDAWQEGADRVLSEQPLLYGHVIVPDQLRRQLKLDTTSSVWLQTGSVDLIIPRKVCIYPLTALPKKVTNDNLISAFKHYIKKCADADHPLVVFQGLFLKYMLFPGTFVEVQVTFYGENDVSGVKAVTMLSELNIDSVLITIQKEPKEDKMNVINTMLAYCHTNDFDPQPLPVKLKQLGGMADLAARAMCHLHIALGSRPLGRNTFQARAGLCHGILLITGPRGSGKTSLVKGLCRKMSHLPVLAYITMIDCKTLRGKTVSHIQRILEAVFDEAAWREPSIIVFDNIDVIIPAPSGPETEMNGEALYAAKNSQVLQGLLAYEIENNSRVAVMATSISRNSLHSSLVESVGKAFIQETLNIGTPDKARVKILTSLMQNQNAITTETLKTLDLGPIALRTEGYVARDLESLVNRALHNRLVTDSEAFKEKITLNMEDFEAALCKFKPVSMRNVPLHKAGELGWHDVGGLTSVKTALVETLLWPSKLFDSCPLRLRSGILLYGAPGTGKTLLAGVVAKECGLNFISIKGPELLSKYIGASEQAVRDLFTRAQSAKPCILFFDEFDSIAPKRGHDSTGVTDRVVNQLLTQLDGVEGLQGVYVLGATSRPDLIDPALLRPGRLDKCLHCQLPDKVERSAILQSLTRKMTLCSDVDLEEVADICTNFTGADLKALLYNAQLCAIHDDADEDRDLQDSVVRIKGDDEQCSIIDNCSPVLDNTVVASSSPRSAQKSPSDNLSHSDGGGKTLHKQKTEDLALNLNSSHVLEKEIVTYLKTMGDQVPDESTKCSDGVSQTYENHRQSTTSIASDEKRARLVRQDEIADKSGMKVKVLSSQMSNRSTNSLGFLPSENQLKSVSSQDGIEQENSETNFADHIPSSAVFDEDENDDDSSHSNAGPNEPPLSLNGDAIQADWQDLERQSQVEIKVTKSSTSETPEGPSPYPDPASTYPPPTTKRKRGCERHNSYTPGESLKTELGSKSPSVERPVTVYTSLEHGLATLSAEDEARYLAMVKEIQRRDESLFQAANAKRRDLPTRSSILVQVCRHHLLDTARTMRPSVSAAEREKYLRIYENFVSSRTGQFDKKVTPQDEKRATLA